MKSVEEYYSELKEGQNDRIDRILYGLEEQVKDAIRKGWTYVVLVESDDFDYFDEGHLSLKLIPLGYTCKLEANWDGTHHTLKISWKDPR